MSEPFPTPTTTPSPPTWTAPQWASAVAGNWIVNVAVPPGLSCGVRPDRGGASDETSRRAFGVSTSVTSKVTVPQGTVVGESVSPPADWSICTFTVVATASLQGSNRWRVAVRRCDPPVFWREPAAATEENCRAPLPETVTVSRPVRPAPIAPVRRAPTPKSRRAFVRLTTVITTFPVGT